MTISDRLEFILDSASVLYIELLPSTIICRISRPFADLLGKPANELLGQRFDSFVAPIDVDLVKATLAGAFMEPSAPLGGVAQFRLAIDESVVNTIVLYDWQLFATGHEPVLGIIAVDNHIGRQIADALADDRLYPSLKEDLPIHIIQKDCQSTFVHANALFCEAEDKVISREWLKGKTDFDLYPRDIAEAYRSDDRRVIESGIAINTVELHTRTNRVTSGSVRDLVHVLKRPLRDADGNTTGVEAAFWPIQRRFEVLAALQKAREQFYRELLDHIPIHIYRKGNDKRITYGNRHYCNHLDRTLENIVGLSDRNIFPRELWEKYEYDDDRVLLRGQTVDTKEEHFDPVSGTRYMVRVIKWPLIDQTTKSIYGLQGIFWEIPDEEKLMKQAAEYRSLYKEAQRATTKAESAEARAHDRETLLREIHHRVFNNLQYVSALLYLASDSIPDEAAKGVLRDCRSRIDMISIVHRTLYQSTHLSHVPPGVYFKQIVTELLTLYQRSGLSISPTFSLTDDPIDLRIAIPCGLIITELVINSIKHAFQDRERGSISVSFQRCDEDGPGFELRVEDDGVGCDIDQPTERSSLGSQLLELLAVQLGGHISRSRRVGACVVIRFSDRSEDLK